MTKRKRDTTKERHRLAALVESVPLPAARPCFDCDLNGGICKVVPGRERCGSCILKGSTMCDAKGLSLAGGR